MARCRYYIIFVLVIFISVIVGEDVGQEESSEDNNREVRELDQERWRVVEILPEADADWIPKEDGQNPNQIKPKRRRLRKRKRRPPPADSSEEVQFVRRRVRPYRLEPWEDVNMDDMKPNIRRRLPPQYTSSEDTSDNVSDVRDSYNEEKPVESVAVEQKKFEHPVTLSSIQDLKNLLKQSGGQLSLSELLQQKNLSLSELLSGSEKAISALTERPKTTASLLEATTEVTVNNKYKRLPPSIGLRKDFNKNGSPEDTVDSLSERETMEAQRKRFAILQPKENKLYANIIKFDVITEPTTERRIFIPARTKHSEKHVPPLKENIEMESTDEPMISSPKALASTTTTIKYSPSTIFVPSTTPKLIRTRSNLPTTNAKLKLTIKQLSNDEKQRPPPSELNKPVPIKISEITGLTLKNIKRNEQLQAEKPMKITINLDNHEHQSNIIPSIAHEPVHKEAELISDYQNETYVTAKQEIMEVMRDPESREKLSRILENRNMTLEELVEQRERGSSQRHLADIFHNNTREPEPKDEPHVGHINEDFFTNIIPTNRQAKSTKIKTPQMEVTTQSAINETRTTYFKQKEIFPTVGLNFDKQGLETFPWKQLYPDLFPESKEEIDDSSNEIHNKIQRIDLDDAYATHFTDEGFFINFPSGVKSALFVSLAIIGLSIVVFLAILVVFRWMNKKNKSLNYCSSLTTKFRPPMLQGRPTTAIKTFMNETLGRKKNYYKSNLQSMSDEIWDANKQRKDSF
ncbi:uncharacterized protein [Diabrotica undecimpunctata]|uniref:uncharacterized protein n=1 Tax=Diabrotica undecimpunctata TaxID=50387 RepID=UPI003B641367